MKRTKVISPFKKMMNKIRKTPPYLKWRWSILQADFPNGFVPKGTQVHHTTNFSTLLREYGIESVEDAIKCKELWKAEGVTMNRGEHFLLTRLALYKYPSKGFAKLLMAETFRIQQAVGNKRPEKKRNAKTNC